MRNHRGNTILDPDAIGWYESWDWAPMPSPDFHGNGFDATPTLPESEKSDTSNEQIGPEPKYFEQVQMFVAESEDSRVPILRAELLARRLVTEDAFCSAKEKMINTMHTHEGDKKIGEQLENSK